MVDVRPAHDADISALLADMRAADRAEIIAGWGDDHSALVRAALKLSDYAHTMLVDGAVVFVGGIYPESALGGIGVPWVLGTTKAERYVKSMTKIVRKHLPIAFARYSVLRNYVDARNVKTIAWLKMLGFSVAREATTWGLAQLPFFEFRMEKSKCRGCL